MRFIFAFLAFMAASPIANAALTSELYTGDAVTVPPGKAQLQAYYNSTFGGPQRVAGGSATFGVSKQVDARLGYGYLWNNVGPDVRLGPNLGVKWRFIGDGLQKPSVAISSLVAIDNGAVGQPHKTDYGGLLIVQYPTRPLIYLINFGRVWTGDNNAPDLRYFAAAAAHIASPRTLVALEYARTKRLDQTARRRINEQIAAAFVYSPNKKTNYTAQLGYLPHGRDVHWNLTLGISTYLK